VNITTESKSGVADRPIRSHYTAAQYDQALLRDALWRTFEPQARFDQIGFFLKGDIQQRLLLAQIRAWRLFASCCMLPRNLEEV
jgi:hypothetical protein